MPSIFIGQAWDSISPKYVFNPSMVSPKQKAVYRSGMVTPNHTYRPAMLSTKHAKLGHGIAQAFQKTRPDIIQTCISISHGITRE